MDSARCWTIIHAITVWWCRKHRRAPLTHEWDLAGENDPSRHTVARVLGSWSLVIRAAGFTPRPRGRPLHGISEDAFRRSMIYASPQTAVK
jgi:hypothetical protein